MAGDPRGQACTATRSKIRPREGAPRRPASVDTPGQTASRTRRIPAAVPRGGRVLPIFSARVEPDEPGRRRTKSIRPASRTLVSGMCRRPPARLPRPASRVQRRPRVGGQRGARTNSLPTAQRDRRDALEWTPCVERDLDSGPGKGGTFPDSAGSPLERLSWCSMVYIPQGQDRPPQGQTTRSSVDPVEASGEVGDDRAGAGANQ